MPPGRFLVTRICYEQPMKPIQFLKETKAELRHVVWPTRRRALVYALIIILFSLALGYMLGGFDALFQELLKAVVVK